MPRKLRPVSGVEVVRVLRRSGFVQVRQRGNHVTLKKQSPDGEIGCVVPLHSQLAIGTLRGILKQAGVTSEDFMKNLERDAAQSSLPSSYKSRELAHELS